MQKVTAARKAATTTAEKPAAEKTAERMTGSNYQELYLQRRKAEREEQEKKARAEAEKIRANPQTDQLKQAQKAHEDQIANTSRAQARNLQGQIAALRQQLGQDQDANNAINGQIQGLMSQLAGIPSQYWN